MSRNLSISGSLLSVFIFAAAVSAVGCVAGSAEDDSVDESGAAVCAGAPDWQQGHFYNIGDKVAFKGALYVATHENPGYDPTISVWFWSPAGTCSSGGGTGGGTCAPAWQQGHDYHTGDKVMFKGAAYVATHDNPGYDPTISVWFWSPTNASCGGGTSGGGTSGGGTSGGGASGELTKIISADVFNKMFPNRNGIYTYDALVAAANSFGFAKTGDDATRKREVAAFFANASHETSGLFYTEEINKSAYCADWGGGPSCACAPGKQYFGRGPLQLSWNGNYCAAGAALGLNLVADPDQVAHNGSVAFRTAFWFWSTSTGAGGMTAHDAIVQNRGFGETIRSINGALECNGAGAAQRQHRIDLYNQYCSMLGVSPVGPNGC